MFKMCVLFSQVSLLVAVVLATPASSAPPPPTWAEHWFEHDQTVGRVYLDNDLALYYDSLVNPSVTWPRAFIGDVWRYAKSVYGFMGPESHLYAIIHRKYGGGHPSYYFSGSHDYRNVIDCGSTGPIGWETGNGNELDLITHEVAHIVESTARGGQGSPAFDIWGDSMWAEIFIYDVYRGLGRSVDATRVYNAFIRNRVNFPRANTSWFKDWFHPIYNGLGGSHTGVSALSNFFTLLSQNFPRNGGAYARGMNMGEFVHFWSGATGKSLKNLASSAFGWTNDYETEWNQARRDFPSVQYAM